MSRLMASFRKSFIRRFYGAMVVAIITPLLLTQWLVIDVSSQAIERQVAVKLQQVTRSHANKVRNFLAEQRRMLEMVSMQEEVTALFRRGDEQYQIALARKLEEMALRYGFLGTYLIRPDGEVIFVTPPEDLLDSNLMDGFYADTPLGELFRRSLGEDAAVLSQYQYYEPLEHRALFIAQPLYEVSGRLLGVVAIRIDSEGLRELLLEHHGLGEHGESLVGYLNEDGSASPVWPLRFEDELQRNPELLRSLNQGGNFTLVNASRGESGFGVMNNYRGHTVFGYWRYLPELEWGMVAMVNRNEALQSVEELQRQIWGTFLLVGIIALLVLVKMGHTLQRPLSQLFIAVKQVGEGGAWKMPEMAQRDELYELAKAFGEQVNALNLANMELEMRVVERTEELQAQKQSTEAIIEAMDDGIIVINAQGRIDKVNPKLAQLVGESVEVLQGQPLGNLIEEEAEEGDQAREFAQWMQWVVDDRIWQLLNTHDALDFWCERLPFSALVVDDEGRIECANEVSEGLTGWVHHRLVGEPMEVLIPVQVREEYAQMMQDFIDSPVFDAERQLLLLTSEGEEKPVMIGLVPFGYEGKSRVLAVMHDPNEQQHFEFLHSSSLNRMFAQRDVYAQRTITHQGGRQVPVQISGALMYGDEERKRRVNGAVIVVHDLTERLRAEQQEQYAAFQAGVTETGASVLHNVGNAITGLSANMRRFESVAENLVRVAEAMRVIRHRSITGELELEQLHEALKATAEVLDKLSGSVEDQQDEGLISSIQRMRNGVEHVDEIIKTYRNVSKMESRPTRFNLKGVIDDALCLIEDPIDQQGTVLTIDCPASINLVLHRNPLIQMLLNLMKNSVEAITERLRHEPGHQGRIEVKVHEVDEGFIEINVSDNGCGMESSRQQQIFNQGFTTKNYGSGLGLHSVGNFVNSLGGVIHFSSEGKNQGATMQIRLPLDVTVDKKVS